MNQIRKEGHRKKWLLKQSIPFTDFLHRTIPVSVLLTEFGLLNCRLETSSNDYAINAIGKYLPSLYLSWRKNQKLRIDDLNIAH